MRLAAWQTALSLNEASLAKCIFSYETGAEGSGRGALTTDAKYACNHGMDACLGYTLRFFVVNASLGFETLGTHRSAHLSEKLHKNCMCLLSF